MSRSLKTLSRAIAAACCAIPLFANGCALTSKAEVVTPRYFSPEPARPVRSPKAPDGLELRLGQVSAASHLDERIAYRVGGTEMGFYEARRWSDNPEAYLRRALERDLFEERGLTRIVAGDTPILDVELTAFEELRGQPNKARVALTFSVRDERRSVVERSLDLQRSLVERAGADAAQRLAETLTSTLDEAVREVGDEVVQNLRAPRAVSPRLGDGR